MVNFVWPYGADKKIKYKEFKCKYQYLLDECLKNIANKKFLKEIYMLQFNESIRLLFKEYRDVLEPMPTNQYMKEFDLHMGMSYGAKSANGRVLFAKKLVGTESHYLIFDDGTRHSTDIKFSWVECEIEIEIKKDKQICYDKHYSDWSKCLAKTYTLEELRKHLSKYESLSEKYSAAHLRAIQKTSSMHSNSSYRAQTGNNLRANTERINAFLGAINIYEKFPEHTILNK